jgi:hypothetical protein
VLNRNTASECTFLPSKKITESECLSADTVSNFNVPIELAISAHENGGQSDFSILTLCKKSL